MLWDRWVLSYCSARPLIFRELCFPRKVNTSRLLSLISTPSTPNTSPSSCSCTGGSAAPERENRGEEEVGRRGTGGRRRVGRETEMMEIRDFSDERRRRRGRGWQEERTEEEDDRVRFR